MTMESCNDENTFAGIEVPTFTIPSSPPRSNQVQDYSTEVVDPPEPQAENQPITPSLSSNSNTIQKKKKKTKKNAKRRKKKSAAKTQVAPNRSKPPSPPVDEFTTRLCIVEEDTTDMKAKKPEPNRSIPPKLSARLDRLVRKQRRPLPQTDTHADTEADAFHGKACSSFGFVDDKEASAKCLGRELAVEGNNLPTVACKDGTDTAQASAGNVEQGGREEDSIGARKKNAEKRSHALEMRGSSLNTAKVRQQSGRSATGDLQIGMKVAQRLHRLVSVDSVEQLSSSERMEAVRMSTALVQMKQRFRGHNHRNPDEVDAVHSLMILLSDIEIKLRRIFRTTTTRT